VLGYEDGGHSYTLRYESRVQQEDASHWVDVDAPRVQRRRAGLMNMIAYVNTAGIGCA
jgi:hypothetical protein